ncbi:ubiquitin carboxyl-terminal hydrolase MINDY-1 isoform X2 [Bufo bufo]|uniref:ubiquitin carboxyl-terminal hydrolase MINDY-1 isoform X1 n=1 Tax=Bufo bufo TaxID=8384 RepID=UPI001ABDFEA5|nr:ubiquitin carboxyl-terminal hydrolase MINDY-1 isoform X1 [Bufo bufo]XP_040267373.1 ubiquitin carboxyl-terminal hydrolase MINDY-1 isoform X2 [Bufo bufo]
MEPSGSEFSMNQGEEVKAMAAEAPETENRQKTQEAEVIKTDSDAGAINSVSEATTERSPEVSEEGEASGSSDGSSSYSASTQPNDTQSEGGEEDGNGQSIPEPGKPRELSASAESEPAGSCQSSEDQLKMENPSLQNLLSSSVSVSPCEEAMETGASKPAGIGATGADYYFVKWINWKGERTPVITQSENGPCPLIAIMNILFLRWKVKLPPQKELITSEELMAHLGDCILSIQPQENSEALQLNFQQNVNDAMTVLPKLSTGLDVNVRFTGVADFEYTPECIVFDLLNIPLYHGWLVDPQSSEAVQAVGKLSYNQLVEKIITCKHSADPNLVTEGLLAEQFLESSAAQLTYHGLCELMAAVKEGELSVFFRNNHFSTLIKHKGHLYLLVTDQGFLQEEKVIWESLHNVEGDSCFCDSDFHLTQHLEKEASFSSPQQLQQRQVDQDYMIALSLQQQQQGALPMSDLELAQQLQKEEYQQQAPAQAPPQSPQQARPQTSGRPPSERRQRSKESDCVLL